VNRPLGARKKPSPRKRGAERSLPPPTPSEAAFERLLATLQPGSAVAMPAVAEPAVKPSRAPRKKADATPSPVPPVAERSDAARILDELFANRDKFLDREPFAGIEQSNAFYTKVVGGTFEGRQDVIAGLSGGEDVILERQPDNAFDPNAIAVRYGNLQLGFLRKEIAKRIAPNVDAGERYEAKITDVTGGRDGKNFGVNLRVRRVRPVVERVSAATAATEAGTEAIVRALIGDHPIRDAQHQVLDRVREGGNTLAVLGTGRGKSFCFQLPAAERALREGKKTIVFYPLRALANDQFFALTRRLGPLGVRILRANGAIDDDERDALDAALADGSWDVIMSTPEFAEYHRAAFERACNRPSLVVVDEAHHVYESKHRPAYGTLPALIEGLDAPQVLALTATAGSKAFGHVRRELGIERWVIDATVRENLRVVDARGTSEADRVKYIGRCLDTDGKGIVYCNSRPKATEIAERLRAAHGDVVAFYHAGMGLEERASVERLFREGAVRLVAATSAFGEGIDLPDVRDVFLYHLNFNFTEFNQQAGRAGRDGAEARIHLLYGADDKRLNEFIINRGAPSLGKLRELYRGMRGLAGYDGLRMSYEDVARTLDIDVCDGSTVGAAVRIFEDGGLVVTGRDDDGRYLRFIENPPRVDLTQTTRYAEGEATREAFDGFCSLALEAQVETLEQIINRPIYPDDVPLVR